jgi:hypothetical protein
MKNQNTKISTILAEKSPAKRLSDNLNRLIAECDIDSVQLHHNTGVPITTINRLRRADPTNNPTLATLVPLADFFAISVSELIGDQPIPTTRMNGTFQPHIANWRPIPHLEWDEVSRWLDNQVLVDRWTSVDIPVSEHCFAVTMCGDSMYPRFPEGTLLIIEPIKELKNRDFIFVQSFESIQPLFKQVLIDGPDHYIKSLNDDFKEIKKIDFTKEYKILGIMIQARMGFS